MMIKNIMFVLAPDIKNNLIVIPRWLPALPLRNILKINYRSDLPVFTCNPVNRTVIRYFD